MARPTFKQVELRGDDGWSAVAWISSAEARVGGRYADAIVDKVYSILLIQCRHCGRRCLRDALRCHCDKRP